MYKYQEEIIENIETAISKMEEMTEEHYRLHIGFRHTNEFDEEDIPIFVEINGKHYFTQQSNIDACYANCYSKCDIYNHNRIELNQEIFLDLNKLLDKIIDDNKKREKFYNKLNQELKSFNKILGEI